MPNDVKKNEDGTVEVRLETGEIFKGDPIEVMNKMGDSYVSGKRWTQNIKAENENLKAQHLNPPAPQPTPQPTNADELALQNYLLDQQAKALGFSNGEEYKQRVQRVNQIADITENEQIATRFMATCPDFPGTDDAVEKLAQVVERNGFSFTPEGMMAGHLLCLRQGAYQPLRPEEYNAQWSNKMQEESGTRTAPPTPPQPGAPSGQENLNPWAMQQDELRKKVLEGGGLGKLLMDLPPGGSL